MSVKFPIYLDNAANTPVCEEARDALNKALELRNPSSFHSAGRAAKSLLEHSRAVLQDTLDCDKLIFTSGGSESVNLAIRGVSETYGKKRKEIVTTTFEHSSVKSTLQALKARGFTVIEVPPRKDGRINPEDVAAAVTPDTFLITITQVCSENGSLFDVPRLMPIVGGFDVIVHIDAVQGFLKFPLSLKKSGVDLISVSGHKVHAPMGIGALALSKDVRIAPQITSGKQELSLRGGTESLPLIAAFAAAVKSHSGISQELINFAATRLKNAGWLIVPAHDAPIITAAYPGKPGLMLQQVLSDKGVLVGSGSACSLGAKSEALLSMKLPPWVIDGAIRLSFSSLTTLPELSMAIDIMEEISK